MQHKHVCKKGLCTLTVVYEQDEPLIYSCFWVQYTAYGKKTADKCKT